MISKRRLSDTELAHRKRVQAGTSMAGSAAGLTSLGLLGGSVVARKKGLKVAPKLKNASTNAAITGAGIGGLSGFNFASIQNEESKRRQPVSKMGEKIAARYTATMLHGAKQMERGKHAKGYKLRKIGADVTRSLATDATPIAHGFSRAASSLAKAYDPEKRREQRAKGYTAGLAAGSAGAAGASGVLALRAVKNPAAKEAANLKRSEAAFRAQGDAQAALAPKVERQGKAAQTYVPNMPARNRGGQASKAKAEIAQGEKLAQAAARSRNAAEGAKSLGEAATRRSKVLRGVGLKRAGIAAGASVALAGASAANEHHRKRGGKTYNGWWEHRY